jgi:hypothetical protein
MLQPPGSIIELCHVVADMQAALKHWTQVQGAGPFFVGDMHIAEHRYRGERAPLAIKVAFGFSGGLLIELIEPLPGDSSVFTEVLNKRGPGYHHVMLRMDFDEGCKRLKAAGHAVALESMTPMGERCVLFDTQDENGGFIELMDLHIGFGKLTEAMSHAHEGWDGSAPQRSLGDLFGSVFAPAGSTAQG